MEVDLVALDLLSPFLRQPCALDWSRVITVYCKTGNFGEWKRCMANQGQIAKLKHTKVVTMQNKRL